MNVTTIPMPLYAAPCGCRFSADHAVFYACRRLERWCAKVEASSDTQLTVGTPGGQLVSSIAEHLRSAIKEAA